MRPAVRTALLTCVLGAAVPATAGAHDGAASDAAGAGGGTAVRLRGCFLTAAFVPRPASVLQTVFRDPLNLDTTFYGPDPLLGIWALSCERSRVGRRRSGKLVVSLVGVPVALTGADAPPFANNFGHRLIRIDTSSRRLAVAARRAGLRAAYGRRVRYRHSPRGTIPFRGRLSVAGKYAVRVSASVVDPTNPHDHANVFERRRHGRSATLSLSIADAFDRFCFPPNATCSASMRAPRGSSMARLLGGRSAPVRAAFDHDKLARVDIRLRRGR